MAKDAKFYEQMAELFMLLENGGRENLTLNPGTLTDLGDYLTETGLRFDERGSGIAAVEKAAAIWAGHRNIYGLNAQTRVPLQAINRLHPHMNIPPMQTRDDLKTRQSRPASGATDQDKGSYFVANVA